MRIIDTLECDMFHVWWCVERGNASQVCVDATHNHGLTCLQKKDVHHPPINLSLDHGCYGFLVSFGGSYVTD